MKAHAEELGIDEKVFDENDIHIHIPEGAIPKDGPSAGITMMTTMASAFAKKTSEVAFSNDRGNYIERARFLPVGGIKEKILAAKRAGIREIILCKDNKKHIDEIPPKLCRRIDFFIMSIR